MLTKLPEANRILLDAAQYIRDHGHLKGDHGHGDDGRRCALGAMAVAAGVGESVESWWSPEMYQACGLLGLAIDPVWDFRGCWIGRVPNWNDAPERTAEEVISLLEEVALTAVK